MLKRDSLLVRFTTRASNTTVAYRWSPPYFCVTMEKQVRNICAIASLVTTLGLAVLPKRLLLLLLSRDVCGCKRDFGICL